MSLRVEHADPMELLCELPNGLAQTCLLAPPGGMTLIDLVPVLREVGRVLRADGTVWLLAEPIAPPALDLLGWLPEHPPLRARRAARLAEPLSQLLLLGKSEGRFLQTPGLIAGALDLASSRSDSVWRQRAAVLGACVLASTSRVACGVCGAPWRRARPGERACGMHRPTCAHRDPSGRCLVLDPFHDPLGGVAEAAHRHGRSFLGIEAPVRERG